MAKKYGTLASGTPFTELPGLESGGFGYLSTVRGSAPSSSAGRSYGSLFNQPSLYDRSMAQNAARNIGGRAAGPAVQPTTTTTTGTSRTSTQIKEFGRADFSAAVIDWNRVYTEAKQGLPAALALIDQFKQGGGFGAGLRQEATELVEGGVARDTAAAVASGMSSLVSSRGLNVLAGSELTKQFANIEDLRAQLQTSAFGPYVAMLSNLAAVGTARPTPAPFIERIPTDVVTTDQRTTTTKPTRGTSPFLYNTPGFWD